MTVLWVWILWTIFSGAAAALVWKKIQRHVKVYLLILINGVYMVGAFAGYAVVLEIPLR